LSLTALTPIGNRLPSFKCPPGLSSFTMSLRVTVTPLAVLPRYRRRAKRATAQLAAESSDERVVTMPAHR
jgi:hypothetical protein